MESKSIVRINAERSEAYCPYCMRCRGLVRMGLTPIKFVWRCKCGAIHDERTTEEKESLCQGK